MWFLRWAIAALLFSVGAQGAVIELQPRAVQRGAILRLMEVAVVSGLQSERQALQSLELPSRGRVGDSVVYTRDELVRLIALERPDRVAQLRLTGADRVVVSRLGRELQVSEYLDYAQGRLLARLASDDGRLAVAPAGEYRSLQIPMGPTRLEARIESDRVRSRMRVWVDVVVDGRLYTAVPVSFDVHCWRRGLVLRNPMRARSALTPEAAEYAEVDVAAVGSNVLQDTRQLSGKRLKRDLERGAALRAADIEDRPPVEAGASIEVTTKVGSVVVQTRAVAERDGFPGQRIGVRTVRDKEYLIVEVIGEDRAMVSSNAAY